MLKIEKIEIKEIKKEMETMCYRGLFLDFMGMALHGYADSPKADAKICFGLGMMCGVSREESEKLMKYLIENWKAWLMDILDGKYKYVNLTEIVYSSWLEYKAKARG